MSDAEVVVRFEPFGREATVLAGSGLVEAAAQAGLTLETPCGGTGSCGKCRVRFAKGAPAPAADAGKHLSAQDQAQGWRLACQTHVTAPATVELDPAAALGVQHQILTHAGDASYEALDPPVRKVLVRLEPPTLADGVPDAARLEAAADANATDFRVLRNLPGTLRAGGFTGTATVMAGRIIDFEPGDTAQACFGAAFDIGTTTLAGSLLDLNTGGEAAVAARLNPQVACGDDVLSRILHAAGDGGLDRLRGAVVNEVNAMLDELCGQAGIARASVCALSFAGNTTMEHLLCGLDPAALGQVPFVPVFRDALDVPAAELGVPIHPRGRALVFPVIGGFVGGDTVACMLAQDLGDAETPTLLVDVGTNGEIVLARDGRIWAASTAAGPAFEGARISCGMRASTGAIEKVVFEDDAVCGVIGGGTARGLCGSGLIDAAAELLRAGIVNGGGRLLPPEELPAKLPEALRRRVRRDERDGVAFVLAQNPANGAAITLTQRDIRELQLATAAIRAGIETLAGLAGLSPSDLAEVRVAGGFGSFIRRSNAQRIGLLPHGLPHERIRYVGNASLAGARWALLCSKARERAARLARAARHVELSTQPGFDEAFAMAMLFPED